jgi:PAS domain S-box-containing protein
MSASDLPPQQRESAPQAPGERRYPLRFVWRMAEDGHFTLDSDEFSALIGPRTAAVIGRPWQDIAADLGLDPSGQVARALATHDTWSGLSVFWPRDGSVERLTVELSGLPVFDRNRIFRGYRGFGICRDVPRLASPQPSGRSSAAAPRSENIVPFPSAAVEPSTPTLSPVERSAFRELSRKLVQRLTAARNESVDQGGLATAVERVERQQPVAAGAPPVPDDDAPAKLASAQAGLAGLNAILDIATDGVVRLDRQGLIVSANGGAEALFGYGSNELAGRAFSELFARDSVKAAYDALERLTGGGVAPTVKEARETTGRRRQGEALELLMTMGRIDDGTDQLCVAFHDITPWKRAAEELERAKRQAEEASSAKSDFLARVSHEIRTPLNAIIGFSEVMMEERFGPIANERYREYLKDIHASGGHLLSLINDLLDLSKIEAGKLELTFASVSLNDLTQQCAAIMQPQANRERVIIRTSLPPALPQVIADARSVRQIVLNLLSNSIKFTGAGGQVIVSTALNDTGEVALRVRDTGIGMSERDLVIALEPFRQLPTSVRGASGTGLGLPLTKALAEANRARFHIKSAPKAGTLVEITFPANRVLAS